MAVDYLEIMGALGAIASAHPQTTSLLMQTYSLWNAKADELQKVFADYQRSVPAATGTLDKVGIVMELMAMHPGVSVMLNQTLAMWQTRIADLQQIVNEAQAHADVAATT